MEQFPSADGVDSAAIGRAIGDVLSAIDRTAVAEKMTARMLAEIPELRGDAQLERALAASVVGNVEAALHGMIFGVDPEVIGAPVAALAYPRILAQRGLPMTALVRAYRLGQATMVKQMHEAVRSTGMPARQMLAAHEWITQWSFTYSDTVIETVVATYQRERDRWLQGRSSARVARVRELLDGGTDWDVDGASVAVGYPLRRHHLASIVWFPDDDQRESGPGEDRVDRLESFVREMARHVGVDEAPLFIAVDQRTAWAWLPLVRSRDVDAAVREYVQANDERLPRIAFGAVHEGIEGFARSHLQAHAARRAIGDGHAVFAEDPGVMLTALLGAEPSSTRDWAATVLGDLGRDSDSDERLRRTLGTYLRHGGSFKAAAAELGMHPNSVKYRVQRARERCASDIETRRLDVEVALLVFRPTAPQPTPRSLS